jgi:hypothetical protein
VTQFIYTADENKVYGSILVTDGNSTNMIEIYRLYMPPLLAGDIVQMTAGCEIRNDAGYNVEFVDQFLLAQNIPAPSQYQPLGPSLQIGGLSGTNVSGAGAMHYFRPNRTEIYQMPVDMPVSYLMYRVRCRSDVASSYGARYCTVMAFPTVPQGYGRISTLVTRP